MGKSSKHFENEVITLFYRFSIVLAIVFLIIDVLLNPNYTAIALELSVIAISLFMLYGFNWKEHKNIKNFTFLYFLIVSNLSWYLLGYTLSNIVVYIVLGLGTAMLYNKRQALLFLTIVLISFTTNFIITELYDDFVIDYKKLTIVFPFAAALMFLHFLKSKFDVERLKLSKALLDLQKQDKVLKSREEKYRLLAENSHDFIIQFNSEYKIEYISPSVSEILGFEKSQIYKSRNPFDMIHREDLPKILKKMSSKESHLLMIFRVRRTDGKFLWLETTSTRKFDENGKMVNSIVNCRDVSDRVGFENQLQESEEKFRFIVNNSSDIVAAYDSNNNCLYMSPGVKDILGYSQEEYYQLNDPFRFALPEDLEVFKKEIKRDLNNKSVNGTYIFRCVHKSGNIVWLEGRVNREFNEEDELDRAVYIFRDITENKKLFSQLEESKTKLSSLIHHMPVGIVFHDTNFKVLLANDSAQNILGFTNPNNGEDIYFNKMCQLFDENDVPYNEHTHPAVVAVKSGKPIKGKLVQVAKKGNEETTWLSLNIVSLSAENNETDSVICTFSDITDKKKTEERLKRSERQFRLLLDHLPAGVVVKRPDKNYEIIHWNEKIAKITGFPASRMIGKTHDDLLEFIAPEKIDLIKKDDYQVVETKESKHEYGREIKDRIVNSIQLHIDDGHSTKGLLVELYMDVTEKVKSEQAFKVKEQLIQRVIAHDIRSSLSSYTGLGEIVENYFENDRIEKVVEIVKALDQTSSMLTNLLDNLTNWTRLQLQDYSQNFKEIDVNLMITNVIQFFDRHTQLKKINIQKKISSDLSLVIDENSFTVIIRNLVSNAIKFSFNNSTICIDAYRDGEFAFIEVKDSGIGIPPEKLKRIFDTYDNKSSVGTKGEGGSGIGLSLVNEFVKMNQGKINVISEIGEGTNVQLIFPVNNHQPTVYEGDIAKWIN